MTPDNTRRVKVLRQLAMQLDGSANLARRLGIQPSFLSQMLSDNPTRKVSDRTVRMVESTLGLPPGFVDGEVRGERLTVPTISSNPAVQNVDTGVVSAAISKAMQMCNEMGVTLTPDKLGDVVAFAYEDAIENGGQIRDSALVRAIRLAK